MTARACVRYCCRAAIPRKKGLCGVNAREVQKNHGGLAVRPNEAPSFLRGVSRARARAAKAAYASVRERRPGMIFFRYAFDIALPGTRRARCHACLFDERAIKKAERTATYIDVVFHALSTLWRYGVR